MSILCKEKVPIAKTKHHSSVFFVTDFNTKGILREHRKTNSFGLNLKKTMDFVYKTTQGKSSLTVGVCRFHEFLPVGPNTLMQQQILRTSAWRDRLTLEDKRALTPLFYNHINQYGTYKLDMRERLIIEES